MEPRIECTFEKMVPIAKVIPNPKNPNKHSTEQIEWLARIIEAHGWRHPITISKRSGFIVAGHCRLEAAKVLKCKTVPVDMQHFESEAEEHAVMMADNFIAELAETDTLQVHDLLIELDAAKYPLDLLGLSEAELEEYMDEQAEAKEKKDAEIPDEQFSVIAECDGEMAQKKLYDQLRAEGYECRLLTL